MQNVLKTFFVSLFVFLSYPGFSQPGGYDPDHGFSIKELQSDFRFVRNALEKKHPTLYRYISKQKLDEFLDSLYSAIDRPMSSMKFLSLIMLMNEKIRDGHTMELPGEAASDYIRTKEHLFPLQVFISGNRIWVRMNASADTLLKPGDEILLINDLPAPQLLNQLLVRQIRDGNNQTYPRWILNHYFREYFGFSFGYPRVFKIIYKDRYQHVDSILLPALTRDSINFFRDSKPLRPAVDKLPSRGIEYGFNDLLKSATLRIKTFDEGQLSNVYHQSYRKEFEDFFILIRKKGTKHLILDLRDNQGGDFDPPKLLLSFLLDQALDWLPGSKEFMRIAPHKIHFAGELFVLINGGSFSSSGILTSYLALNKKNKMIGEESGGNEDCLSGDPIELKLPYTSISLQVSTVNYTIRPGRQGGHGVMPDVIILPGIEDILNDRDPPTEYCMNLISHAKN